MSDAAMNVRLGAKTREFNKKINAAERKMKKFKSCEQAQTFLDRFEFIRTYLKPKQHLMASSSYRKSMNFRLHTWKDIATNLI